jgi:hypothetical protein
MWMLAAECLGSIGLRIHIDNQHRMAKSRQRCGEVDDSGRLSNASLLIQHTDDVRHIFLPPTQLRLNAFKSEENMSLPGHERRSILPQDRDRFADNGILA